MRGHRRYRGLGGAAAVSTQLTNAVVMRKRAESSVLFAMLSGQHAGDALRIAANDRIKAGAPFAVGGVGQAVSAWLGTFDWKRTNSSISWPRCSTS